MSDIEIQEREYLQNTYAGFWQKQTHVYGIGMWEQKILDVITDKDPKRCFEVGMGTGFPIATSLADQGITVDGCDLAESSLAEACKNLNRKIGEGIYCGDLLELDISEKYDITYCVRSSWYMHTDHFLDTLRKMSSMTKDGGYLIFDYMDRANKFMYSKAVISPWFRSIPARVYNRVFRHRKKLFFPAMFHSQRDISRLIEMEDLKVIETITEAEMIGKGGTHKTAKRMYVLQKSE